VVLIIRGAEKIKTKRLRSALIVNTIKQNYAEWLLWSTRLYKSIIRAFFSKELDTSKKLDCRCKA
jgi:hypothetical protein